jgi:hypothetical protein
MAAARASRGLRRIFVIGGVAAVLIGVGLGVVLGPMSGGREEASPRAGVRVEMPHATAPAAAANAVDPAAAPPAAPAASAPPAVPAPVAMPDVVEPAATAPPPAATGSARPVAGAAPASTAAPIDAGVGSAAVPVPADDAHRRTPPRRPTKSRSKEQIGESRI